MFISVNRQKISHHYQGNKSNFVLTPHFVDPTLYDYSISVDSVEKALAQIQTKKSIGPDSTPKWILKDFASIFAPPITNIFNASISQGQVPTLWKSADVIPVTKVPKPVSIDNDLRPISLTAVLSKILEGHVFDWLYPCVSEIIDPRQFGNLKGVSTTHALVHLLHRWQESTNSPKTIVRSCMIDFSKAFDRIDHNNLLLKLEQMKIPAILRYPAQYITFPFLTKVSVNND
jgi:hypothetical protein